MVDPAATCIDKGRMNEAETAADQELNEAGAALPEEVAAARAVAAAQRAALAAMPLPYEDAP